jgi:hypothetical protein
MPGRRASFSEFIMVGVIIPWPMGSAMERPSEKDVSPLRRHAADALRRARKLPVGHERNDLRQVAMSLLWLEKNGLQTNVQHLIAEMDKLRR